MSLVIWRDPSLPRRSGSIQWKTGSAELLLKRRDAQNCSVPNRRHFQVPHHPVIEEAPSLRSGWLPAGAQELADNHPWTRRAVEKNPRFPGTFGKTWPLTWHENDRVEKVFIVVKRCPNGCQAQQGYVPPEALFCWTEPDFASYINSGGFVKPKMRDLAKRQHHSNVFCVEKQFSSCTLS